MSLLDSQYDRAIRRVLVHFARLDRQVSTIGVGGDSSDLVRTGTISAGVLAVMCEHVVTKVMTSTGEWVAHNGTVWSSAAWARFVVDALLEVVTSEVTDPVVWVMGEFLSSDSAKLEEIGLIPEGVPLPVARGHRAQSSKLILRVVRPSDVVLPSEQGLGHMTGARIAVFSRQEEPGQLYDEWLAVARSGVVTRQGVVSRLDPLLESDTCAPDGAAGWLAPFGEEDRNHVLVAKAGTDPSTLAAQLADRLELPLVVSNCGPDEFRQWEDCHILPSDVSELLSR